ncbi:MAG TPA: toll/interleukin-1 receptor domain-containing protein [Bryobacteraceae bacterium]|nr:toll/interleukin-1 receptor domain-containing protein [Bryobacteraceae bacterium]
MPGIFISYRREDNIAYAGRIYDRLLTHFDRSQIFMDIDTIEPGVDFVQVVERAAISCDVLLAVIGKQWMSVADRDGHRRLDSPEDFVRLEIATALAREIRVIPLLVGGAAMPRSVDLPEDLAPLARRHGLEVPDVGFHQALTRVIDSVQKQRAEQSRAQQQRTEAAAEARRQALAQQQALAEQVKLAQQHELAERQAQALAQQHARAQQELAERQRQAWLAQQRNQQRDPQRDPQPDPVRHHTPQPVPAVIVPPPPPAPLLIPERQGWAKWLLIFKPSGWAGWLVHALFVIFVAIWFFVLFGALVYGLSESGPWLVLVILAAYAAPAIGMQRLALHLDRKARRRALRAPDLAWPGVNPRP